VSQPARVPGQALECLSRRAHAQKAGLHFGHGLGPGIGLEHDDPHPVDVLVQRHANAVEHIQPPPAVFTTVALLGHDQQPVTGQRRGLAIQVLPGRRVQLNRGLDQITIVGECPRPPVTEYHDHCRCRGQYEKRQKRD